MKRLVVLLLALVSIQTSESHGEWGIGQCKQAGRLSPRPHSVSILEFGAVGDGKTLNTLAFQNAIFYAKSFADKGGAQLYVPKGRWLTGSFNITSHLTLFLDRDATIIGTEEPSQWPPVEPLPSYGQGIELPSGRHRSLINGLNLTDIVITGDNGTIDGQGSVWWQWYHSRSLNYSRPHLVELVNCDAVVISNLTFLNSAAWGIHPIYCSDVQIQNVTIIAPADSPLTDGIVPDSCSDVCIEDCSIIVGHDAISLKSGWDQFGISFAKPTSNVYINGVRLQSSLGSALSFGSEMSGGISDIHVENIHIYDSATGIKFKTTRGRGGFIQNVAISTVQIDNVNTAIQFTGNCGRHPDDHYNPDALPFIKRITLKDMVGKRVSIAGNFSGIENDPFTAICLLDIDFSVTSIASNSWLCSNVIGVSTSVYPKPCSELSMPSSNSSSQCFSPESFIGLAIA